MKLFKKLAAVALAAVLALSMVGCGSVNYKTELTNIIKDATGQSVENDKTLDNAAAVLLKNAQEECGKLDAEAQKNVSDEQIIGWLTESEAVTKAKLDTNKRYNVSYAEDPNYASNTGNQFKYVMMLQELIGNKDSVGDGEIETENMKIGFAQGKIGDKNYVVMVFNGAFGD